MAYTDIKLPNKYQIEIANFAEKCYRTNKAEYKRRGQDNPQKVKQDIYQGKVSEYAVYVMYSEKDGCSCSKPDINIYKSKKKSFSADLIISSNGKEFNGHVKSQLKAQAQKFGVSWMFQKYDPLVVNPIPTDYIIPTILLSLNLIRIYQPIKAINLVGKYGKPKVHQIRHTKVALYGKDIGIELDP